jgi:hypothetical protein
MNFFRRYLSTSERAHVAALLSLASTVGHPVEEKHEEKSKSIASNDAISQTEAAKRLGVSRSSVQRAKARFKEKLPKNWHRKFHMEFLSRMIWDAQSKNLRQIAQLHIEASTVSRECPPFAEAFGSLFVVLRPADEHLLD